MYAPLAKISMHFRFSYMIFTWWNTFAVLFKLYNASRPINMIAFIVQPQVTYHQKNFLFFFGIGYCFTSWNCWLCLWLIRTLFLNLPWFLTPFQKYSIPIGPTFGLKGSISSQGLQKCPVAPQGVCIVHYLLSIFKVRLLWPMKHITIF